MTMASRRLSHAAVLVILGLLPFSLCDGEWSGPPCRNPWFVPSPGNASGDSCVCSKVSTNRAVRCDSATRTVSLLLTYCMTFDNTSGDTVLASCPNFPAANYSYGYTKLPVNVTELNAFMCGGAHRKGVLCSECSEGYTPGPLSYDHSCVQCNMSRIARWSIFLLQQFLPVTIFFFAVLVLRLRMMSQPGFILFAQVYSSTATIRLLQVISTHETYTSSAFHNYGNILVSVYGIWNLDFFRPYLTHLCLEDDLSTLGALALEYLAPAYVLLLTAGSFTLIELHGRGCRALVALWRPFSSCFYRFRQHWNMSDSVIQTLATFTVISYTKLLAVSFKILNWSFVNKSTSDSSYAVPYYAANQSYFTGAHAGYATFAILVIIVLCIPPILLLIYPFRAFQALLNKWLPVRWQQGLRIFVECHQGHLRNGSDGGCDCRYLAAWYFILRIIIIAAEKDNPFSPHFGRHAIVLVLFLTTIVFALLRPFTKLHLTITNTVFLALLSIIYWLLLDAVYLILLDMTNEVLIVLAVLGILPLVWWVGRAGYWLLWKKGVLPTVYRRARRCVSADSDARTPLNRDMQHELNDSLPHRVSSPEAYDGLVPYRTAILNKRTEPHI